METRKADMRMRLNIMAAVILLVGVCGSILIYLTAGNDDDNALGYEVIGGHAYPIRPEDSKMYRHGLELYGGKANLMADEFSRWFDGLWHGKSLAFTVACGAIVASSIIFIVAGRMPADSGPERRSEG